MPKNTALALPVESRIRYLRNHKVILDTDLAELYGVSVKRLNEQVKRNRERFPTDFLFRLTAKEHEALRSQIATSNRGRGGRRFAPYAFTEHGAIMAATVLNSERAVEMSVFVVRAFVRLRETLATKSQDRGQAQRTGKPIGEARYRYSGHHHCHQGTHGARRASPAEDRLSTSSSEEKEIRQCENRQQQLSYASRLCLSLSPRLFPL
jgi:ORF6N domain